MEKVLLEMPIISYLTRLVVKLAFSRHQVIFPFTLVVPSLLVLIFPPSFSFPFVLIALEFAAVFELLYHINRLYLI